MNTKIAFEDRLLLNAGQKYCRMLQWEHSAILLTFIKLPFVIKTCVLFVCLVALSPKSTAMVIAGRSVHLITLFPGQA